MLRHRLSAPCPANFIRGQVAGPSLPSPGWRGIENIQVKAYVRGFSPLPLPASSYGRQGCLLSMNEWRVSLPRLWAPNCQGNSALGAGPPKEASLCSDPNPLGKQRNRWLDWWLNTRERVHARTRTHTHTLRGNFLLCVFRLNHNDDLQVVILNFPLHPSPLPANSDIRV